VNAPITLITTLFGVLLAAPSYPLAKADTRPNIIFFLSDDHRWDRLGCAGHPFLKTPTLDRLAREGVRFSNMFVTTSICAASRATILTGLYERTHQFTFRTRPIDSQFTHASYPVLLRKAGYKTGFIGKFGVNVHQKDRESMFDTFQPIGRGPYFKKQPDGSLRHESELAGDRAIDFIDQHKASGPFCLSVSFNAAHAEDGDKRPGIGHFPWPKAVDGLYDDVPIKVPRLAEPKIFESHPEFMKKSMNRIRFFWRWDTPEKYATNLRAYYRMITGIDGVIDRVTKHLEKAGVADNTIIIFCGDNGYYEGQRGFAGKWSHYEESLRVPLIIYDPRADKKRRNKVAKPMALNTDIAPTILGYAGLKAPGHYQGQSLRPIMDGEKQKDWRRDTFCEHLMENATIPKWEGVRSQRYVYARYFQQKPQYEYLHDLKEDPDQLKNLVNDPVYAKALKRMRKRCNTLRDEYGGEYDPSLVANYVAEQQRKRAEAQARRKAAQQKKKKQN
jgi:arylsulfatase A-like enzyme